MKRESKREMEVNASHTLADLVTYVSWSGGTDNL